MGEILGRGLEAGTAGWAAAMLVLLTLGALAVIGAWLVVVDLRDHRLPGDVVRTVWAASALALSGAALLADQPQRIPGMVLGSIALWALYWLLRRGSGGALGRGDVRLAGLVGTVLGFDSAWHVLWGTALAFALGGAAAIVVLIRGGELQTRIPFGPPMIGGAAAALALL